MADTGNDPAAQEPLPSEGAEISSGLAALPAAAKATDSEINEGAREAADEPIPAPAIPLHPLAAIVPMRDDASIRETARLIGPNDPIDPIIQYEGKILDRWDLYLACLLANRAPTFETYTGNDPLRFLIDRQLNRGHLNESQRAMLGARVCDLPVGGNQYSEGRSIGRASELLNVSPKSISRAKKVLARGILELVKAVDDGTLSIWKAFGIAKLPESEQRAALSGCKPPGVEGSNSLMLSSGETSDPQVEASATDNATGSAEAKAETPAAEQPEGSSPPPSTTMPSTAAGTAGSRRTPHYNREWIWPGYIPSPGVTAIVGSINAATSLVAIKIAATVSAGGAWPDRTYAARREVVWLTAQHGIATALRGRLAAAGAAFDFIAGRLGSVHIVGPELDAFGLPIHHLSRDLHRLERELSNTDKVSVAVIDYLSPYVGEDAEQALHDFRGALRALKDFAAKFGVAVILPCRLPCHGGSGAITRAIAALSRAPPVDSVLLVEGTDRGTVVPKKTSAGVDAKEVAFRTNRKPGIFDSASVIVWEMPTKSAARREPYANGSLSNREIANTSNPEVSDESTSPGVVPGIPATPSGPSTPPETASADSIEGAAATRGTGPQSLRAGASANVGKPVLALNKPLARKPAVPATPPFRRRVPGTPARFSSVAAEKADEKPRRLAKSAVSGKQSVGLRLSGSTKRSTKVRKLGKRKVQQKKGKTVSRDKPSDWW